MTSHDGVAVGEALAAYAEKEGIKFFQVSFLDIKGVQRAKLVPASAIKTVAASGAGFAGYATWFDLLPAHPDVVAVPDPKSVIKLPWRPEVAWVASDMYMGGKPLEQAPRRVLKKQIERAAASGYTLKTGVEVEFMLLEPGKPGPDGKLGCPRIPGDDVNPKPCYEINLLMNRYEVLKQIIDYLEILGWGCYQADHEDANAQFELNFLYDDVLVTADRIAFYRYMVCEVARQHGLVATFMPKPFADKTGNGQHMHFSLWNLTGTQPLFENEDGSGDEYGLNELAINFLGGVVEHVQAMAAITNPNVNSYKRLGAGSTDSGATWAPTKCTHGGNDRTHMVRVPDHPHYEFRLADMAANSYLLAAVLLGAGLNGIEAKADPGPRMKIPCSEVPADVGKPIPSNMLDALRAFEADQKLMETLGMDFSKAYLNFGIGSGVSTLRT